jgi:hypothetical protein
MDTLPTRRRVLGLLGVVGALAVPEVNAANPGTASVFVR